MIPQHEHCRVPVTALAFAGKYLLAGEGPFLELYDHAHNLVSKVQLFTRQSIHGISLCNGNGDIAIVWGGALVSAVVLRSIHQEHDDSNNVDILALFQPLAAPDWILNAQFSPTTSSGHSTIYSVALVTAHNSLLLLNLDISQPDKAQLQELTSQSKCILYSACIQWLNPSRVLVASGTVFGDIIVWSCHLANDKPETFFHKVLTGHDGSIFGVRISPELYVGPERTPIRLLASCSDDRTVRIWDLSSLPETSADPQSITDLPTSRETGFGTELDESLPGESHTGRPLCQAWGHMSRIWTVDFVRSTDSDLIANLITFGEDATCHYWSLKFMSSIYTLENAGMLSLHSGKNIWSSALQQKDGAVLVATGGADGSIATLSKDLPFARPEEKCALWSVSDAVSQALPESPSNEKLRSYAFIGSEKLLVAVNSGNLFVVDACLPTNRANPSVPTSSWEWIAHSPDLQGYSVATGLSRRSLALFSGKTGSVLAYSEGSGLEEIASGSGKTAALFLVDTRQEGSAEPSAIGLVTTVEQDIARLLPITENSTSGEARITTTSHSLQLPPGFIVTSFAVLPMSKGKRTFAMGSRNGTIAIYYEPDLLSAASQTHLTHTLLASGIHGDDAITDLKILSIEKPTSVSHYIYSSGRDGTFAVHEMRFENSSPLLDLVHRLAVPEATTVEQINVVPETGSITLCAFRSKHFIVYDIISEKELFNINCGGANRTWTFEPSPKGSEGTLAWTKASQLCVQEGSEEISGKSNDGGNGREIKSIAISPEDSSHGRLIATGAEDTDIKIHKYHQHEYGRGSFKCIHTIKKHNTGIQNLEWSDDGRYLFSSGGFEELFAWRVRDTALLRLGVVCDSVCPPESELPDLRITHFSVVHHPTADDQPERDLFTVTTIRSDSTIRIYSYRSSPSEKIWNCMYAGTYLSCSLTQVLQFPYFGRDIFITTATDGHAGLFAAENSELSWQTRFNIHQSTVHCTELRHLGEYGHLLFSGGDDNALSVSRLSTLSTNDTGPFQSSVLTVPRAHTAAITGLAVIDISDQPHVYWLLTTSIDQRLKLWEVLIDAEEPGVEGVTVRKLANVYTPVADVSGLATYVDGSRVFAIVCGVGMDVWSIDISKRSRALSMGALEARDHQAVDHAS